MNVLIIEDELLIQKSLQKLLQLKGCTVEVTSLGREAIALISTNEYDRVICDLMLQDITGFDILEEAKNKYSSTEISEKFIIITAYSSPQVLENAAKYNCHVLKKPFESIHSAIDFFMEPQNEK